MRLTELAHAAVRECLRPGDIAVDATVGNGHDATFLAELVGPTGHVFGFDVQAAALARPVGSNVTLFLADHATMAAVLAGHRGRVAAVMFNLGYLPGGDKAVTTRAESTVRACDGAVSLLRPGGVLTVVAYRGHPGGADECDAVRECLRGYVVAETVGSVDTSPVLFVVRKSN